MRFVNFAVKKQGLTAMVFCGSLLLAQAVVAETNNDHHPEQAKREWSGVYYGMLPCKDCYGIKTTLALNANNSYLKITQNTGKSLRDYVEKGKFNWDDNTHRITLIPRKGDSAQQYLVEKDQLIQLDANGNRITGKDAERYILNRTDMKNPEETHGGH